jgi:hypothetical protein
MPNPSPALPPNLGSGFRRNDGGQRRTLLKKFVQAAKNLKHSSTQRFSLLLTAACRRTFWNVLNGAKRLNGLNVAQRLNDYCNPANPVPKTSLSVRVVEAIDCALARSSALFFGLEKPWAVPL